MDVGLHTQHDSVGKERPHWEKMEKRHSQLAGNGSLQNSVSKSKYGDPQIKEIKTKKLQQAPAGLDTQHCPLACGIVSQTRQSNRKIHLKENLAGPLAQSPAYRRHEKMSKVMNANSAHRTPAHLRTSRVSERTPSYTLLETPILYIFILASKHKHNDRNRSDPLRDSK